MLILTRKTGESIAVGEGPDTVHVIVKEINGQDTGTVRLAFDGPPTVPVWRTEIAADRALQNEVHDAVYQTAIADGVYPQDANRFADAVIARLCTTPTEGTRS